LKLHQPVLCLRRVDGYTLLDLSKELELKIVLKGVQRASLCLTEILKVLGDQTLLGVLKCYRDGRRSHCDASCRLLRLLHVANVPVPMGNWDPIITYKLLLSVEGVVGSGKGHLEVLTEEGLVIGTDLDAKVQNFNQKGSLKGGREAL
jgi:hypothetical protein